MATACVAPGATAGVMLNVSGLAARPVAAGTVTVQDTAVVVPWVSVATTLGVVLEPAKIGRAACREGAEKLNVGVTVRENRGEATLICPPQVKLRVRV